MQDDERQRWLRAIADLMAEAGTALTTESKVDCLREAAAIHERRLEDLPRALMAWQTAFAEDPANDDVALAVERVADALGAWETVLADTDSLLADVNDRSQRTALLLWLARWRERFARDEATAERHLEEAAQLSPDSVAVAEAQTQLYERHGEWARAAAVLARTGSLTGDPQEAVSLLLEAARIIRARVGVPESAVPLYRRILEIDPGNLLATEALDDLAGGPGLDPEVACREFRRALEADPHDLSVIRRWADIALANERWDDVRFLFEKVYARLDTLLAMELAGRSASPEP